MPTHDFYCSDFSGKYLKLGNPEIGELAFENGWAHISTDHPHYEELVAAANSEHNFAIEDLGVDSDRVDPTEPGANVCSICGKAFANEFAKKGHVRSHMPRG